MRLHGKHAAVYPTMLHPEYDVILDGPICYQFLPLASLLDWRSPTKPLKWLSGKALSSTVLARLLETIIRAEQAMQVDVGLFLFYRLFFLHHFSVGLTQAMQMHTPGAQA